MRMIRFRAWDNVLKEHLPNVQNHIGNDGWSFGQLLKDQERYVVEQFTGLLDKNGKEIYEGDIISEGGGGPMQIIWQAYALQWIGQYTQEEGKSYREISYRYNQEYEVIGNIHQDKHLL